MDTAIRGSADLAQRLEIGRQPFGANP